VNKSNPAKYTPQGATASIWGHLIGCHTKCWWHFMFYRFTTNGL